MSEDLEQPKREGEDFVAPEIAQERTEEGEQSSVVGKAPGVENENTKEGDEKKPFGEDMKKFQDHLLLERDRQRGEFVTTMIQNGSKLVLLIIAIIVQ
ncbi:MAG TPA: hypothetical protein VJK26_00110 [Patescibacteria group bacterium]|nr:hypothetical protein [Patescibacteria group bacterium]